MTQTAFRSQLLTFNGDPAQSSQAANYETDGLLIVDDGKVVAAGPYAQLAATLARDAIVHDLRDKLIVPGFIDTHIHYPQTDMIASPAPGLLPWLDKYTFPTERQFGDPEHAREVADFFVDELLACGTTSALVYCTVHKQSADALFAASDARDLRMIAGKVLMDRNCPEFLRDTAQSGYDDSAELIGRWHGKGRQMYALTPRFAPTSTEAQLEACGELARRHPDVFVQSHVAENVDEVKWVAELFPGHRSYLDIYDRYGLLRPRAVYGHCIHLDDEDRRRMAETRTVVAHCPTSNFFLGSGLFDFDKAGEHDVPVTLATDVGGGTSFSMLQTMNEAHKVARLSGHHLTATRMFWLATAGADRAHGPERQQVGVAGAGADEPRAAHRARHGAHRVVTVKRERRAAHGRPADRQGMTDRTKPARTRAECAPHPSPADRAFGERRARPLRRPVSGLAACQAAAFPPG